jgi:hypothetical protein
MCNHTHPLKIQTIQPFCGQMFGDPWHHHTWCNLMAWWPAISFGKLPIPLVYWWSKIYLYRLSRYMTCWYNCYISRYIPIHCNIYLYSYTIYLCYLCLFPLNIIEYVQFLFPRIHTYQVNNRNNSIHLNRPFFSFWMYTWTTYKHYYIYNFQYTPDTYTIYRLYRYIWAGMGFWDLTHTCAYMCIVYMCTQYVISSEYIYIYIDK